MLLHEGVFLDNFRLTMVAKRSAIPEIAATRKHMNGTHKNASFAWQAKILYFSR